MASSRIGSFVDSGRFLERPEKLDEFLSANGYVFLRGVLNIPEVTRAREELVAELARQGAVVDGASEPLWTGAPIDQIDDNPLYGQEGHQSLCESTTTRHVLQAIFGGPVFIFRSTTIRYAIPNDELHRTPAHQDHFFIGPNDDFRTVWIPLMNIPESVGGLCLAAGSHRHGILPHPEHEEFESAVLKGRKQKGVPWEDIPGDWLTTDYAVGDILVFHSHTVHWGLPNRSQLLRISLDTRAQPASRERSFQATHSILEQRAHRKKVEELAMELGMDREEFERVSLHMLQAGIEPSRRTIQEVRETRGTTSE